MAATRRRVHIAGLPVGVTAAELRGRFTPFGTVHAVDLLGTDSLGRPRSFAYVTLETTDTQWRKCVATYSGARWRGATLKLQEARPTYMERLQAEWAAREAPVAMAAPVPAPANKKKKKAQRIRQKRCRTKAHHAADMTLVNDETAVGRRGWKLDRHGRAMARLRFFVRNHPRLHKRGRIVFFVNPAKRRIGAKTRFGADRDTPIANLTWHVDELTDNAKSTPKPTAVPVTVSGSNDRWWEDSDEPTPLALTAQTDREFTGAMDTTQLEHEREQSLALFERMFGHDSSASKPAAPAPAPTSATATTTMATTATSTTSLRSLFNVGDHNQERPSVFLFGSAGDAEGLHDTVDDEVIVLKRDPRSATSGGALVTPTTNTIGSSSGRSPFQSYFFFRHDMPVVAAAAQPCASSAADYIRSFFFNGDSEEAIRERWEGYRGDLTVEYKRKHKSTSRRQHKQSAKQHHTHRGKQGRTS